MLVPNRHLNLDEEKGYRYGFQGQEKDDEVKGEGKYLTGEHEDMVYRVFEEKVMIYSLFIPRITHMGNRNSRMFYLLSEWVIKPKCR